MNYLKRLASWLSEGICFYLLISFLALLFVITRVNLGIRTADLIRYYGLILQLIGAFTIIYSLKKKLFIFKRYGIIKFYLDYFKRFPFKKNIRHLSMKAESGELKINTGDVRISVKPREDLKDIIRYIDEEFTSIYTRLQKTKNEFHNEIQSLKTTIGKLESKHIAEILETKEIISETVLPNIWVETFGVFCVFLGLILATVPEVIDKII